MTFRYEDVAEMPPLPLELFAAMPRCQMPLSAPPLRCCRFILFFAAEMQHATRIIFADAFADRYCHYIDDNGQLCAQ